MASRMKITTMATILLVVNVISVTALAGDVRLRDAPGDRLIIEDENGRRIGHARESWDKKRLRIYDENGDRVGTVRRDDRGRVLRGGNGKKSR